MAIITPKTDVYLLKCPLELNDANQLTFANAAAQAAYFQGLTKIHVSDDDFTYQRKDGVMRVPYLIDDLYGYNYCMYKNDNHSNKWFFAYITGLEYLNDNVTAVSLKTDTYQTWMFDLTYKNTFVEREHVNDDSIGANTVPENIETGELIVARSTNYGDVFDDKYHDGSYPRIVELMAVTCMPDGSTPESHNYTYGARMNGLGQGLFFMVFTNTEELRKATGLYDHNGRAGAIYSITECYRDLFNDSIFDNAQTYTELYGGFYFYVPDETKGGENNCKMGNPVTVFYPNTVVSGKYVPTFDGHVCKNNKMLTYPFSYIRVTNHAGGEATYRWEDFTIGTSTQNDSPNVYFQMFGAISTSPNYKICPCNYKKDYTGNLSAKGYSYDWGLTGQKLPPCSWISDYYTNWMTQNGVNIVAGVGSSFVNSMLGVAGSSLTATGANSPLGLAFAQLGAVQSGASFLNSVASSIGQMHAARTHPDQVQGDANTGDLNYSIGFTGYSIYTMCLKREWAERVDHWFSMFGYKVNEVKVPNITGRRNWNFVKTIGCYIEADIPQDDLEEIKSMFDKGITFWHNPTTFMDYSQNNDII